MKNVQFGISRPLGSREIQNTKLATVLRDTLYIKLGKGDVALKKNAKIWGKFSIRLDTPSLRIISEIFEIEVGGWW